MEKKRIKVFARCRPLNSMEERQGSPSVVKVIPEKKEILCTKDGQASKEFFFDKVFSPDTKQIAVYEAIVGPLIQEVLGGYNCTVFAYGQTGTGKTYTMEGERNSTKGSWKNDSEEGIIPRSLHHLFEELNKGENMESSVQVSFLELYNEELFDLLSSTELSKLYLYDDPDRKGSVKIQGLEGIPINNKDEVYSVLEKGTARRQTAATLLNATSSRSHTVFSVTVHIKENGEEFVKIGKLNLVDLAGSENVGKSGAVDKRAREAGNINQSLLTLGRVITALIEKKQHIPYRESKLTRLLQDSLGGTAKTSIIATISPALSNFEETTSTLNYATKAKGITNYPTVNRKMTIKGYTEEIKQLQEEIKRLMKDNVCSETNQGVFIDADNYASYINGGTLKEKKLLEKNESLTAEYTKLQQLFASSKEEHCKTSEQLTETTHKLTKTMHKLTETSQKLSETKQELDYTKHILSKTILESDENQSKISVQKNIITQLTHQAKKILQHTVTLEARLAEKNSLFEMYSMQHAAANLVDNKESSMLSETKEQIVKIINQCSDISENTDSSCTVQSKNTSKFGNPTIRVQKKSEESLNEWETAFLDKEATLDENEKSTFQIHKAVSLEATDLECSQKENEQSKSAMDDISSGMKSCSSSFTCILYDSNKFQNDSSTVSDIGVNSKNKVSCRKRKTESQPIERIKKIKSSTPTAVSKRKLLLPNLI